MRLRGPERIPLHTAILLPASFVLLAVLSVAVARSGWIVALDQTINIALAPYRSGPVLAAFLWISGLGTGGTVIASTTASTALLTLFGRPALARVFWLVLAGAEASTWALKFAVARVRPPFIPEASALSPSFPSAHATASAVVYGFLAYVIAREGGPKLRAGAVILGCSTVALVGFSRIFLSVHYLNDVLGGWLVAGAWLLIGEAVIARIGPRIAATEAP